MAGPAGAVAGLAHHEILPPRYSRLDSESNGLGSAVAALAEGARQRLGLALLVHRPAAEEVLARRQARQQGAPVDLAQSHRPGAGLAAVGVEAVRALRD